MRISSKQVGQCVMLLLGVATGAMLFKRGWFWTGVMFGVISGFIIYADVRWLSWPDEREGPRLPDGS